MLVDNGKREMQRASLAFMVAGPWWVTKSQLGGESGLANDLEEAKRQGVFLRGVRVDRVPVSVSEWLLGSFVLILRRAS